MTEIHIYTYLPGFVKVVERKGKKKREEKRKKKQKN